MDTETQLKFEGTEEEKSIAGHAFEVMKRKGMLFAANAPIRMSIDSLVKALTKSGGALEGRKADELKSKIEASLLKNGTVFARDSNGEFVTTKGGHAPQVGKNDNAHTFKDRLNTDAVALNADAAKEYAESLVNRAAARAERVNIMDTMVDIPSPSVVSQPILHTPHITFDNTTVIPQHLIPQPVVEAPAEPEPPKAPAPQRLAAEIAAPPAPTPAPVVQPARPAQPATPQRAPEPTEAAPVQGAQIETPAAATHAPSMPVPIVEEEPAAVSATPAPQPVAEASAPAVAPQPAPVPVPVAPAKPAAPVVTGPIEVRITTEDGPVTIDLRESVDDLLADPTVAAALRDMITSAVQEDGRLVRFGSDIFPEEGMERFSKGDFRRIKDFLDEPDTGGVASDREIMEYALNRRQEHPDYERLRLSLDYRMIKEKKDFEFVGIDTNRLWMSAGITPVASPKRKPAEIGQDYRFLEDPAIASVEEEEAANEVEGPPGPLEYSLTYYEYENGVLPYDRRFKRLVQGPMLEDQRVALLQFEIPQLYSSILAELRYPTANRGGFIMGLADFFAEHMVPGATFTIMPTDRADNIFEFQFVRTNEEEDNLLQLDERKGRYVFRPVSFTVGTDPTMLLTQEKFGKLQNHKKLEEAERKRPDTIIINAFELIGENTDGKYWAILDDLFPVVNIERPISRSWLKTLLSGAYPFFYADESTEGAYFYDPTRRPS